jgi:hypothetical protein
MGNAEQGAVELTDAANAGGQDDVNRIESARHFLAQIEERFPGKSVEIRIPFVGAIQCIEGVNHRRGTPPNTAEMDVTTFLSLCEGTTTFREAERMGAIDASGSDISKLSDVFTATDHPPSS